MSVYDKRYNVCAGQVSHYVDTPEEILAIRRRYPDDPRFWITEGYGDYRGTSERAEIIRRTTRQVPLSEIEYLVQRNEVEALRGRINSTTTGR